LVLLFVVLFELGICFVFALLTVEVVKNSKLWAVGNTKVFMRDATLDILNAKKWEVMEISVVNMQRTIRSHNALLTMEVRREERKRKIASQIVIARMMPIFMKFYFIYVFVIGIFLFIFTHL
jgi:myosin heavy subunit